MASLHALDVIEAGPEHAEVVADIIRRSFAARPELDPPRWRTVLFETHPPTLRRIGAALAYEARAADAATGAAAPPAPSTSAAPGTSSAPAVSSAHAVIPQLQPLPVGVRLDPIDEANPGRRGGWQAPSRSSGGTSVALASAPARQGSVVRRPPSTGGEDGEVYEEAEIQADPSVAGDVLPGASAEAEPAVEAPAPRPGSSLQGWKALRRSTEPVEAR